MNVKDRINAYLMMHRAGMTSVDGAVDDVKDKLFYGMSPISDAEIRAIVIDWAKLHAIGMLSDLPDSGPGSAVPAGPPRTTSEFIDAVNKALNIPHEKVVVGDKDSDNIKIGVTGATATLKGSSGTVELGISWTGTLKLKADSGPFHLEGAVNETSWEITLSLPRDSYIPDMSTFGQVFSKGVQAAGQAVDATRSFKNIGDTSKVAALIKPHVTAVEDAVDAVSGIAKAPRKGGTSFGFKIGSPNPGPGEQGMPGGVQGQVVFTWVF